MQKQKQAPTLQNKVFIMKLEMEAPPLPPFSPSPAASPFSPPSLPFWGLRSTQDNAQSWDAQGRLTAGQSSREVATWGLKLLPWEVSWLPSSFC